MKTITNTLEVEEEKVKTDKKSLWIDCIGNIVFLLGCYKTKNFFYM